ncbi:MAG: F0F1 ATP synthase subunit A [Candidatus Absconditabacteria bacterium]|nr:F0F1 ATP synthase subunit A [Candidatus Absconditabacteria bacterium]
MSTEPILGIFKIIGTYLDKILSFVSISWWTEISTMTPLMRGVLIQIGLIIIIVLSIKFFRKTKFGIGFSLIFEYMYEFFEEILGKAQKEVFKVYVVSLFFIILFSNLLSYILDLVRVMFTDIEALPQFIVIPTTNFNFNLALALVSIIIMLYVQFRRAGFIKFILEYIPITGKGILDIERGTMKAIVYYPIKIVVKAFDIAISLFVGLLDIIGIAAKVISLTARLYGNMLAGGILLGLLVTGVNSMFQNLFAADFPVLGPLILYAQGLLVALIQAFVFPLLVAIFIKIAQESE